LPIARSEGRDVLIRVPQSSLAEVDVDLVAGAFDAAGVRAEVEAQPEEAAFLGLGAHILIEISREVGIDLIATATWEALKPALRHLLSLGPRVMLFLRGGGRRAQRYELPSSVTELDAALKALGSDISDRGVVQTTVRGWSADGKRWEVQKTEWR